MIDMEALLFIGSFACIFALSAIIADVITDYLFGRKHKDNEND